jgi:hypothetical protein
MRATLHIQVRIAALTLTATTAMTTSRSGADEAVGVVIARVEG